jgi:hypothetical protein
MYGNRKMGFASAIVEDLQEQREWGASEGSEEDCL